MKVLVAVLKVLGAAILAAVAMSAWGGFYWSFVSYTKAIGEVLDDAGAAHLIRAEFPSQGGTFLLPLDDPAPKGMRWLAAPFLAVYVDNHAEESIRDILLRPFVLAFAAMLPFAAALQWFRGKQRDAPPRVVRGMLAAVFLGAIYASVSDPFFWSQPAAWHALRAAHAAFAVLLGASVASRLV
jgi:hypothetical protein